MKLFRSLFFGCAAMLAAVLCMSAPASAVDCSPGVFQIHSVSYDYVVPDVLNCWPNLRCQLRFSAGAHIHFLTESDYSDGTGHERSPSSHLK